MPVSSPAPTSVPTPLVVSATKARLWIGGALLFGLLAYYFIGVDQGAVSVFGSDMHIHEFVHDSRHLLGFPCH
ncbi:CbtB-domain containing protein [Catenulispora sp. NF23]|uniref:CbtB-domain containing protein n=1 Tax=Catenulispora pinistramenti TaxID=2705254 RepID=A0ABS5KMF1_9ACTN|nr:CbtB domain-containing protein [Catenulispora pinistramenti]MBS2532905.1 CbtB-domain containing protein [Catenulispora pinistramenti]MBS2547208.1 CbtB-domain containing protein [Catenulispora pinistramenti]